MYAGVSGMMAFGNAMNVTGDNIANVNTVGFKSGRANFADILANQVANGSTTMQFGNGTHINNVASSFASGSRQATGNATDMMIEGAGFFTVRDSTNNGKYYTRAGQFTISDKGKLVNPNGMIVQGYKMTTNASGVATRTAAPTDIDITGVQSVPKATTNFRMGLNLNSSASAGSTFSTSFNVYNALGEATTISYTFTKNTASQSWHYAAAGPSGTTLSGSAASGTITFSDQGIITSPASNLTLSISNFPSGAQPLTMTWNLVNSVTGQPRNEITGYSSDSTTNAMLQDGYSTGVLRGLSVDDKGIISGLFSNGQTQEMWQLQLADFISPWGLTRVGDSMYAETSQSGQPIVGVAKAGGFGSVSGSALELSNVDLSQQFVDMIQNQRAFQANSRIITTVDSMMQEAVNLVR